MNVKLRGHKELFGNFLHWYKEFRCKSCINLSWGILDKYIKNLY
ncbi:hypothetical protein [Vallitalea guaymasensis]|nr:hypothetical protein [Vallitalea guaymasensis]